MQTANPIYEIIRGTILLAIFLAFVGWLLIRSLRRSEDPARLVFKWVLTAPVMGYMIWQLRPAVAAGGAVAIDGIVQTCLCGLALTIIWRQSLISIVSKPFGALYDGGDTEIEPQPYYSIAEAKRKRGNYPEAIAEIRKQLEKFPTDLQGQMMLAEIQAENLNDLPGAELTIQRLCSQPHHAPLNIAYALNTLADWHLKYGQDREAARQDFQKIIELCPDTEMAMLAAQRIAHLAGTERILEPYDRKLVGVPGGVNNLGLLKSSEHLRPAEADPAKLADEYVKQLEEHPLDAEVREKLALLYAEHYQRPDLATDQLEQLILLPNQPAKQIVHWLNLLADLQIKHAHDLTGAQQTLQRITEQYPDWAAAHNAQRRLDILKLELKGNEKRQPIKLGTANKISA